MRMLVDLIGNPQDEFRIIHVAGTNGKGSVCAMLDSTAMRKTLCDRVIYLSFDRSW